MTATRPLTNRTALMFAVFCFAANGVQAGQWPQILGPDRNGIAQDEKITDQLPTDGPPLVWKRSVGRGYSGVAVQDNRAILFHREGDEEIVEALDAATGRTFWKKAFPAHFRGSIFPENNGPNCVPVIDDGRVFAYGGGGDLYALELETGKKLWTRALYKEYRSRAGLVDYGYFGAGSTPIVESDAVLVNVGGFNEAGIVSVDTKTGKTNWAATDELPSYSSPAAATLDGVRHVVFVTRLSCLSIDPANGRVRWRFRFGQRGPTVNAATPLLMDDRLFVTASYGIGAELARFSAAGIETAWANDETLSSQYDTSIHHDGYLYGTHGRADVGVAELRCVHLQSGKVAWSETDFGVAAMILADGKLLIVRSDGELVIARPTPDEFLPLTRAKLITGPVRALPALADGKLYVRNNSELRCFDLSP